jgi:hypothetical protein
MKIFADVATAHYDMVSAYKRLHVAFCDAEGKDKKMIRRMLLLLKRSMSLADKIKPQAESRQKPRRLARPSPPSV